MNYLVHIKDFNCTQLKKLDIMMRYINTKINISCPACNKVGSLNISEKEIENSNLKFLVDLLKYDLFSFNIEFQAVLRVSLFFFLNVPVSLVLFELFQDLLVVQKVHLTFFRSFVFVH